MSGGGKGTPCSSLPSNIKSSSGARVLSEGPVPKHGSFSEKPCVPAVRFVELQSVVCHSSRRLLGYLRRRVERCFHIQPGFLSDRPPDLANRVHSLMPSVLFAVSSLFLPATPREAAYPARVPFLFATSPEPSTNTGEHPLPLSSALRFSQPLDGLIRLRLRGLIASHCHV
jgi:hypothetical protein